MNITHSEEQDEQRQDAQRQARHDGVGIDLWERPVIPRGSTRARRNEVSLCTGVEEDLA